MIQVNLRDFKNTFGTTSAQSAHATPCVESCCSTVGVSNTNRSQNKSQLFIFGAFPVKYPFKRSRGGVDSKCERATSIANESFG